MLITKKKKEKTFVCDCHVVSNEGNYKFTIGAIFIAHLAAQFWEIERAKKRKEKKIFDFELFMEFFYCYCSRLCLCVVKKERKEKDVKTLKMWKTFSIFYSNEHVRTRLWCLVIPFSKFLNPFHLHVSENLKIYHYHIDWRAWAHFYVFFFFLILFFYTKCGFSSEINCMCFKKIWTDANAESTIIICEKLFWYGFLGYF